MNIMRNIFQNRLMQILCVLQLSSVMPFVASAQDTVITEPIIIDSNRLEDFRLDAPATPSSPKPPESNPQTAPKPSADAPAASQTRTPKPAVAKPSLVQPAAPDKPEPQASRTPSASAPEIKPATANDLRQNSGGVSAYERFAPSSESDTAQNAPADDLAEDSTPVDGVSDGSPATGPAQTPADQTSDFKPDSWQQYWPHALISLLVVMGLVFWLMWRKNAAVSDEMNEILLETEAPDLIPAAPPEEPSITPPGPQSPPPAAAASGFVTSRPFARPADVPAAAPRKAPAGTVGIPITKIAPQPAHDASAAAFGGSGPLHVEIRAALLQMSEQGAKLEFEMAVVNRSEHTVRQVALHTMLISGVAGSDQLIRQFLMSPEGDAVAEIPDIHTGRAVRLKGDISLTQRDLKPIKSGDASMFVPLIAISVGYLGEEGLDRTGSAYIVGIPSANAGRLQAFPLENDLRKFDILALKPLELVQV